MTKIIGAILCGGKSSRFGEENKALAKLAGKPLIQHVIDRLQPQVSEIIYSGEQYDIETTGQETSRQWVADIAPGQRGPLVGVLSCLEYLQKTDSTWLLISACDTPLLPSDLGEKLLEKALAENHKLSVAHDSKRLQPANSLWHRDLYQSLKDAIVDRGIQGFHQFLDSQNYATAAWENDRNCFINLNTQLDLANANNLLQGR